MMDVRDLVLGPGGGSSVASDCRVFEEFYGCTGRVSGGMNVPNRSRCVEEGSGLQYLATLVVGCLIL